MSDSPAQPDAHRIAQVLLRRELFAGVLVLVIGVPFVVSFGAAAVDGARRDREAPFRAVLGDDRFEELESGAGGFPHYLGRDRLAPDFELSDREGNTWRLSDHRGQVVVMNFWSITCPPCIEEMPTLETLAELTEGMDDVELVAVSTDAGWDAVSTILPRQPRLTHLFDPSAEVVRGMFGTELFPETWIIDKEGVIRFRFDGQRDWSDPLVLDMIARFR